MLSTHKSATVNNVSYFLVVSHNMDRERNVALPFSFKTRQPNFSVSFYHVDCRSIRLLFGRDCQTSTSKTDTDVRLFPAGPARPMAESELQ